ncbi:MAG: GNAT family N-acetyltransferase [Oscillospiraceae bacterium]|nr:GNAT family N-acetyltransferase [Oscillospiraceae bacterium]
MSKHLNLHLCPAVKEDVAVAMTMIQDAKNFHKEIKLDQWSDAYPAIEDIEGDIAAGKGYFLCDGETKVGYLCLDTDGEEVYSDLEGQWLTADDAVYLVVHRLAMSASYRGKGYSSAVFPLAELFCREKGIKSIRVDTHKDNQIMQYLIPKAGFTSCGLVYYFGSPRTAFEKIVA